jgi:uncharacterized membrane protein
MNCLLNGLLIAAFLFYLADLFVYAMWASIDKNNGPDDDKTKRWKKTRQVLYEFSTIEFMAITVGLVVSSVIVTLQIKNSKTLKNQVIKDKCAM